MGGILAPAGSDEHACAATLVDPDAAQLLFERVPLRFPQASDRIFDWCVTKANHTLEPRLIKAQFGDGYAQRRPAGLLVAAHDENIDAKTAGEVV